MDLTDPVKAATNALYEALKAKIHEEIEDLKRKARLERAQQKESKRPKKTVVVTPAEIQNNYSLLQNMP